MNPTEGDFGTLDSIEAEAVGRPGDRRFRLVAIAGGRAAAVWMENFQLAGIAEWLDDVATKLDQEEPLPAEERPYVAPVPLQFDLEFRVGQLGLGYAEDEHQFSIQAFDAEAGGSRRARGRPSFRGQISRVQARGLSARISEVVSAGRQVCPLCQAPMNPDGHVCPRSNGHEAAARI